MRREIGKIFGIALLLVTLIIPSTTTFADGNETSWTILASMSKCGCGLQIEVIDGKIYALGGSDSSLEVYDPSTDVWTTLAPMPIAQESDQTEVIGGKIYSIGNVDSDTDSLSSLEVYDPATDTWTILASMSTPRYKFQTEVIDGKIYAIGGLEKQTTDGFPPELSSVEVYDPSTDTWTTVSSMSTPRYIFQTEVINGKIYAIGGEAFVDGYEHGYNRDYLSSVEVYDSSAHTWSTITSMSVARSGFQTEIIDGTIYALGGIGWNRYGTRLYSVEAFTITSSTTP